MRLEIGREELAMGSVLTWGLHTFPVPPKATPCVPHCTPAPGPLPFFVNCEPAGWGGGGLSQPELSTLDEVQDPTGLSQTLLFRMGGVPKGI